MEIILNDFSLFCHVAQSKSMTKSSLELKIPLPTLSRRISNFENKLNKKLLFRSTHGITLTPSGQKLYSHFGERLLNLSNDLRCMLYSDMQMQGVINLSAPRGLYYYEIHKKILKFRELHPNIELNINLLPCDGFIDYNSDVIISANNTNHGSYTQKRINTSKFILCGSPEYFHSKPTLYIPEDIWAHQVIKVSSFPMWTFRSQPSKKAVTEIVLSPVATFTVNDFDLAKKLVLSHEGIALLPTLMVESDIQHRKIIQCLSSWEHKPISYYLIYSHKTQIPKRVKRLVEHLSIDI